MATGFGPGRPSRRRARRPSRRCRCRARVAGPGPGSPCAAARSSAMRPEPGVRGHAAADQQVLDAVGHRGVEGLAGQYVADRLLEAARRRRRPGPARRPAPAPRPSGRRRSSGRRTRSRSGAAPGRGGWSARAGSRRTRCCRSRAALSMYGPPGNGSPSSRATLSNASPAASSMVAPSGSTPPVTSSTRSRLEWPPLTSIARQGSGSGPCSSWSTATWEARWLTP